MDIFVEGGINPDILTDNVDEAMDGLRFYLPYSINYPLTRGYKGREGQTYFVRFFAYMQLLSRTEEIRKVPFTGEGYDMVSRFIEEAMTDHTSSGFMRSLLDAMLYKRLVRTIDEDNTEFIVKGTTEEIYTKKEIYEQIIFEIRSLGVKPQSTPFETYLSMKYVISEQISTVLDSPVWRDDVVFARHTEMADVPVNEPGENIMSFLFFHGGRSSPGMVVSGSEEFMEMEGTIRRILFASSTGGRTSITICYIRSKSRGDRINTIMEIQTDESQIT